MANEGTDSTSTLQSLLAQQKKLEAEKEALLAQNRALGERITANGGQLREVNERLRKARAMVGGITITEHAYLRYFERVLGFNLEELADKVLPPEQQKLAQGMGEGTYPVGTHRAVVKDGKVVTIKL